MESMTGTNGLAEVHTDIARACRDAGRDPATVTLVAVSKTFGADAIELWLPADSACSAKTGCRKPKPNGRR
jgi:uncharacterized pyridoxal phosphate-containing UPF0001 family protein